MNAPAKLGLFGLGLGLVFAAAFGTGRLVGPVPATAEPAHRDPGHATQQPLAPGGLQVAQDGYRLQTLSTALSTGSQEPFSFRILGPDGLPVTSYTPSHDRDLHLIVVRRDLTGYQHLHPTLDENGAWSVSMRVGAAGEYRVFADFQPAGRDSGLTLGVDVPAAGDFQPRMLPPASRVAAVDGYEVTLDGDLVPGTSSKLTLTVTKNGAPVIDLQPYLSAYGHLVALRDGDLAYLHVHPEGEPGEGRTSSGPRIVFYAEVPSAGEYRLFLDFSHAGVVRTAEFTAVATRPRAEQGHTPSDGEHS